MNNKTPVDMIFLDFRKAFDTVPHNRLIDKLTYLKINHKVINFVKDFLSNRTQKVVIEGKTSNETTVTSGVPQGSVLGPLLFLIYINSLSQAVKSSIRLFADDCLIYREIKSANDRDKMTFIILVAGVELGVCP